MEILPAEIEAYLTRWVPDRDAILEEMERLAALRHFPIVGPVVGRLLAQLTLLTGARRILEMGAGFGYSAYWMARALPEGGRVIAIERAPDNLRLAREFFRKGGLIDRVEFRQGDALEVVQELSGLFDLIFVDLDKAQYPASLPLTLPRLKRGGLLLTDNLLWGGRVLALDPREESTRSIQEYTRLLYRTPDLYTTILPLRDGIALSLKLT